MGGCRLGLAAPDRGDRILKDRLPHHTPDEGGGMNRSAHCIGLENRPLARAARDFCGCWTRQKDALTTL